ncbi:GDP-mannose 4,6-dehydratase [candidate division WOR-3 bacterium]|nr:GDP-mannose 4,6-dehydratase [candidate division WOR-3 bacterium]
MKRENILVTGGAGFIGSHLVERLIEKGYFVICLDNFNNYYDPDLKEKNISGIIENPNFKLIRGDILDVFLLDDIFSGTQNPTPGKIVHLAAMAGVRPSIANPGIYVDVDVKGTVNLLEMAKKYNVEQFIFASSSSVYGLNKKTPFSEDDPVELQISPYATAKRAAEIFCKTYNNLYRIPVTILRLFSVYGERQRPDMAIRKFTKLILEDQPIKMFGDGESERDYTYISDCIDCILSAIIKPLDFEIINVGSGRTIRLKKLIAVLEEVMRKKARIQQLDVHPGEVPTTHADTSKAKKLLNYKPKITIEEGIRKFFEWHKKTLT